MVFEKVRQILCEHFSLDESEIMQDSSIADDFGGDSLDLMEIIMALEDEFDINIPDEDVEDLKNVDDIVRYIESAV